MRHPFWAAAAVVSAFAALQLALGGDEPVRAALSNALYPVFSFAAAFLIGRAAAAARKGGHPDATAWIFLAAAQGSYAVGDIIWAFLTFSSYQVPFPSPSDFFYLGFYVLFVAGLILLSGPGVTRKQPPGRLLDVGITLLCAGLIFWVLLVGPVLTAGIHITERALMLLYLALDMAVLTSLLRLASALETIPQRAPLVLLLLAGVARIVVDGFYAFRLSRNLEPFGAIEDLGWISMYVLAGLAGVVRRARPAAPASETMAAASGARLSRALLAPWAWMAAAFAAVAWSGKVATSQWLSVEAAGLAGVLILVFARQLLTLRELGKVEQERARSEAARLASDESLRLELQRGKEALEAKVRERTAELEYLVSSLEQKTAQLQRTEELAQLAEARYRQTFDTAIEGLYRTTVDGCIELMNPSLARILGYRSEDLATVVIGRSYEPYLAPGRRAELLALLETNDQVLGFESEVYRKDGGVIWVSENVTAVRDPSGKLTGLEGSLVDVTDSKRLARETQASEARYRDLADSVPQPLFELDAAGIPTFVNRAARGWYGTSIEDLLAGGSLLLGLVTPEQRKTAYQAFGRALAGEWLNGLELTAVRGDGQRIPVLVFASPVIRDGVPAGVRILAVDIEAQKSVEEALRESEQRQAAVLNSLPVAVYTATVPSELDATWMSESVQRFTGYPAERFVREPGFWQARLHPLDAARAPLEYRLGAIRGEVTVEYRWQIADGSYRWLADSAVCTQRLEGCAVMTGIIRDVTAERNAEEEVRSSERYYRGLFDGAHDAILVFDPDTEEVLDANAAAVATYRMPRSELVGLSLEAITRDVPAGKERIADTLRSRSMQSFETVQLRRDGTEVRLEVNASVVDYHGRRAILSINRDVSERRALEDRLRLAEKMEAVGHLAAGVAHDFNNLLAIILGTTELLLRGSDDGDARRLAVETIHDAALRGRDLTQSLLGFSRRQVLHRRNIDLASVVRELLPILHGALPSNIILRVVDRPVTVFADQGQIEQILLNLTVNARDAMPNGGELELGVESTVITDEVPGPAPWARPGRYGRLRVRDTGVGMNESVLADAMKPFFTTKGPAGTGLGLASVYGIAKQHGGMVAISSQPGSGTVVDVYLPEGEGAAEAAEPRPVKDTLPKGNGERVLLAEDEPTLRLLFSTFVRELGYEVVTTEDGQQALAAMIEATEPFSLIVTDLTMPGMSGIELFHEARARGLSTNFVFTSGHSEEAITCGLPDSPGVRFLRKPFDMASLGATLRAVLGPPAAVQSES